MLLTFTKIGSDVFPRASDATLDLAQKFGMDLSQASVMLGKALNDPIAGVSALRRIGVMLTAEQEASIKGFMAVNDIASAQAVILGELETEVGGVAQAYGTTFAGQVAIFNNRLDDMKEKIGVQLIPALIRLMDAAKPLLDWFMSLSPAQVDLVIKIAAVVAALGPLSTGLGTAATVLPALGTLASFITATLIPAVIAFTVANAAWLVPLGLVIAAVVLLYYAFKTNFGGITDTIVKLNFIMKYYFNQMILAVDALIKKLPVLAQALLKLSLPSWLQPGSPTPLEIGLIGIAGAMDLVVAKTINLGDTLQSSLNTQLEGFGSYYKTVDGMTQLNTKFQADAMNQQTQNTNASLQAQAAALVQYKVAAADFWGKLNIPMTGTSTGATGGSAKHETFSPINFESMNIPSGGNSNVTNNVKFEQTTPAINRRQVEEVMRKTTGLKK